MSRIPENPLAVLRQSMFRLVYLSNISRGYSTIDRTMADLGNGAGSFGVELLDARPGLSLKDGRYEVVTYHHSTENSYFRFGHSAYIARDTK